MLRGKLEIKRDRADKPNDDEILGSPVGIGTAYNIMYTEWRRLGLNVVQQWDKMETYYDVRERC